MSNCHIAIDGPAGSGKSTVAKRVAEALGYTFVDTGALYRCVALAALEAGLTLDQPDALGRLAAAVEIRFGPLRQGRQAVWLGGREVTDRIRQPDIDALSSPVSAVGAVRAALLGQQRAFAAAGPVVMEGRDIQTVVLPEAQVKVFLTASPNVRAERRLAQMPAGTASLEQIAAGIAERDARDSSRATAPLAAAAEAVLIDTDVLTIEQVAARIIELAGGS
jgi:cytidylate kinase